MEGREGKVRARQGRVGGVRDKEGRVEGQGRQVGLRK